MPGKGNSIPPHRSNSDGESSDKGRDEYNDYDREAAERWVKNYCRKAFLKLIPKNLDHLKPGVITCAIEL